MGYVVGGLIAGFVADALGYGGAIAIVAGLTAASGLWVAFDMPDGLRPTGDEDQDRAPDAGMPRARSLPKVGA